MKWMDKLDTGASSGPFKKILGGHLLKWLHLLTRKEKKRDRRNKCDSTAKSGYHGR